MQGAPREGNGTARHGERGMARLGTALAPREGNGTARHGSGTAGGEWHGSARLWHGGRGMARLGTALAPREAIRDPLPVPGAAPAEHSAGMARTEQGGHGGSGLHRRSHPLPPHGRLLSRRHCQPRLRQVPIPAFPPQGRRRPHRPCSGCFSVLSEESQSMPWNSREEDAAQPGRRAGGRKGLEGRGRREQPEPAQPAGHPGHIPLL